MCDTVAAHADELRLAMEAAAAWRAKFQKPIASTAKSRVTAVSACQVDESATPTTGRSLCDTCASGSSDLGASETAMPAMYAQLALSPSEPEAPEPKATVALWAFTILLSEVALYLSKGVRAPLQLETGGQRHVRLYCGPWGRTGLCRRGGSVLVLVDAAAARAAGAKVVVRRDSSLVLSPGSAIPSSTFRRMLRVADGATLYERSGGDQVHEASGGDDPCHVLARHGPDSVYSSGAPTVSIAAAGPRRRQRPRKAPAPPSRGCGLAAWLRDL